MYIETAVWYSPAYQRFVAASYSAAACLSKNSQPPRTRITTNAMISRRAMLRIPRERGLGRLLFRQGIPFIIAFHDLCKTDHGIAALGLQQSHALGVPSLDRDVLCPRAQDLA